MSRIKRECVFTVFFALLALLSSVGESSAGSKNDDDFDEITYEEYASDTQYQSGLVQIDDEAGFGGLYSITKSMIGSLVPKLISDLIIVTKNHEIEIDGEWSDLLKDYVPLLTFLVFLSLFTVVVPIWGMVFCCCRCCCKPKKGEVTDDDKREKIILSAAAIILFGFFLFGIVCAFATTVKINDGAGNLTDDLRTCVSDANHFFNDVSEHVEFLLKDNFQTMSNQTLQTLESESDKIMDTISTSITNLQLDPIISSVEVIGAVQTSLAKIENDGANLKQSASDLNLDLKEIQGTLRQKIDEIDALGLGISVVNLEAAINGINYNEQDFPEIPNFNEFNDLKIDQILESIEEGKDATLDVISNIQTTLTDTSNTVKESIKDAEQECEKESNNARNITTDLADLLNDESDEYLREIDKYIDRNLKFIFIFDFSTSFVLLLIVLLMLVGLAFGLFFKASNNQRAQFCSSQISGIFFMTCIVLLFLSALFLGFIIAAHMLGILAELFVCEPLREPNSSEVMDFLDKLVDFSGTELNISVKSVLSKCYDHRPAFDVFNLESEIDLEAILDNLETFDFNQTRKDIEEKIDEVNTDITLLEQNQRGQITNLLNANLELLDIYDQFQQSLENIENVRTDELSEEINKIITELQAITPIPPQLLIDELTSEKDKIPIIQISINNVKVEIENLRDDTKALYDDLSNTFKNDVNSLLQNIDNSQNGINELPNTKEELKKVAIKMSYQLESYVRKYLDHAVETLRDKMAPCKPMADTIQAGTNAFCKNVVQPVNGYWFSLFWCSVLYVPTIVVCLMLTNIFRRQEKLMNSIIT